MHDLQLPPDIKGKVMKSEKLLKNYRVHERNVHLKFHIPAIIVLQLFGREFVIISKSNLLTNRQTNFHICITVSLNSSRISNKHVLQNKATIPTSIYLFKVTSAFVQR